MHDKRFPVPKGAFPLRMPDPSEEMMKVDLLMNFFFVSIQPFSRDGC